MLLSTRAAASVLPFWATRSPFVGAGFTTTGAVVTIPWAPGVRAGDSGFVQTFRNSSAAAPSTSGWSFIGPSFFGGAIYWKDEIDAADLTATVDLASGSGNDFALAVAFRGFTGISNLTNQGDTTGGADSKAWTGVTKSASCRALVLFSGAAGNGGGLLTVTSPVMAGLKTANSSPFDSNASTNACFYNLTPSQYVDGTAVTITGYTTGYSQRFFAAFELT